MRERIRDRERRARQQPAATRPLGLEEVACLRLCIGRVTRGNPRPLPCLHRRRRRRRQRERCRSVQTAECAARLQHQCLTPKHDQLHRHRKRLLCSDLASAARDLDRARMRARTRARRARARCAPTCCGKEAAGARACASRSSTRGSGAPRRRATGRTRTRRRTRSGTARSSRAASARRARSARASRPRPRSGRRRALRTTSAATRRGSSTPQAGRATQVHAATVSVVQVAPPRFLSTVTTLQWLHLGFFLPLQTNLTAHMSKIDRLPARSSRKASKPSAKRSMRF